MCSLIFANRSDPQQAQVEGASTTTHSRGRCSETVFTTGLRRSKPATFVVFFATCSAQMASSAAVRRYMSLEARARVGAALTFRARHPKLINFTHRCLNMIA